MMVSTQQLDDLKMRGKTPDMYLYGMCKNDGCMIGYVILKKYKDEGIDKCNDCNRDSDGKKHLNSRYIASVCAFCDNKAEYKIDEVTGKHSKPYCDFHEMNIEEVFKKDDAHGIRRCGCVGLNTSLDHITTEDNEQ